MKKFIQDFIAYLPAQDYAINWYLNGKWAYQHDSKTRQKAFASLCLHPKKWGIKTGYIQLTPLGRYRFTAEYILFDEKLSFDRVCEIANERLAKMSNEINKEHIVAPFLFFIPNNQEPSDDWLCDFFLNQVNEPLFQCLSGWELQEARKAMLKQLKNEPIAQLNLSPFTKKALHNNQIHTLAELRVCNDLQLNSLKGIKEKRMNEIALALADLFAIEYKHHRESAWCQYESDMARRTRCTERMNQSTLREKLQRLAYIENKITPQLNANDLYPEEKYYVKVILEQMERKMRHQPLNQNQKFTARLNQHQRRKRLYETIQPHPNAIQCRAQPQPFGCASPFRPS